MTTTSRRQWTDETIRETLLPIATELGRMPRRAELTERGLGGLWSAMGRRGGVDAWRAVVATQLAGAPPAGAAVDDPEPPAAAAEASTTDEDVRVAAFFLYENGPPGDPADHWLAAEQRLTAAN